MKKAVLIFIWFGCLMIVWTVCGKLTSMPSNFLLLIGTGVMALFIALSFKTKCFTTFIE